jgi:hypothetical protein
MIPNNKLSIGLTIRCFKITTYCADRSYKNPENALTNQLTNRNQKTAERDTTQKGLEITPFLKLLRLVIAVA